MATARGSGSSATDYRSTMMQEGAVGLCARAGSLTTVRCPRVFS
jgi:hypothetical protein